MRSFAYARPESLDEVFSLLAEYGPRAGLLAGGTDLLVRLRSGRQAPDMVIDLKRVEDLRGDVIETGGVLRVGARAVISNILADERIQQHFPALIEAGSVVGSVQIRNRATLAGNICNASPAADTAPALLIYDAAVNVAGAGGHRSIALSEFFTGPGRTVLQRGEVVHSIDLPVPKERTGAAFGRITRRFGVDLASINLCCRVRGHETVFAFGAAAPTPILVRDSTGTLWQPDLDREARDSALATLIARAAPITDIRASKEYREAMLMVASRRSLDQAIQRLSHTSGFSPRSASPPPRQARTGIPGGLKPTLEGKIPISLRINGETRELAAYPHHTLLEVLRDDLRLCGTKECCSAGECGTCTVLLNGRSINSCLVLAAEADGEEVTTIEGLGAAGELDALQQAFLDRGAVQCGFCIPGMVLSAKALLLENPHPSREEIREGLVGNLCRCAGYSKIVEAVEGSAGAAHGVPRAGGIERVTGRQVYTADIRLENVLHVKLVQLPCARARVAAIDADEASHVEGVRYIMIASDLPRPVPRYGPTFRDRPVLADGETKFFGEAVAAVAAESLDAAALAASLVHVDYEELPAVLNIDAALDPASPPVQESRANNTLQEWKFGWGDVDEARAACIVENTYSFPMVTHFAIEPHAFLAAPDPNGVTVWSPVQHPFVLQRVVAEALGWPVSKVRIVAPDPGGAFGGKGWPKFEPLLAYLALKTGRAVRLVLTLEETFQAARRTSARVHARTGFDSDGRIVFQDLAADFLIGAYADIGTRVVSKASYAACGPYRTPAARIRARALLSHTTPSTAFRGFGTPQASWAVESQLNEAAAQLGIDRVEIRRRNLARKGEEFIPGDTACDGDWHSALSKAAEAIGWEAPLASARGRGISLGLKSSSTSSSSFALARLHFDGSATILSGTSDMGQGARTVLMQVAAEELGIPLERISVVMGDTAVVPYDSSTSASRSTVFMGNAVLKACQDIKAKLREMAAEVFGVDVSEVRIEGGAVVLPGRSLSYAELLFARYGSARGEVIGIGQTGNPPVAGHPLGGKPAFWELMCTSAEVEVDPETGVTRILKLALVSDVGRALNPQQVEAQDEGAAIMGLGHTLMEHLTLDEHGRIVNLGAVDYRIPTIQDTPLELNSILIENGDGPGPYGAKGAGEGGTLAVAAAVGAAINQAIGAAIRDLPLTPERVWRAVQEKAGPREQQEAEAIRR